MDCFLSTPPVMLDSGRGKRRLEKTKDKDFLKGVFKNEGCRELPRQLLAMCYDSFLFIRHSSLDSLPYLHTILRNALRLNTASLLHAVHGSLVPFPPSLYGRPFLTRVYLNAVSSLLSHCPSIPLISTLALTLRTLLGPCAGSPRI